MTRRPRPAELPDEHSAEGPPLVIVEARGGLGNQMFQYAAAWALARRHDGRVKLDVGRLGSTDIRELELGAWTAPVEIASAAEIKQVRRDTGLRRARRRLLRLAGHSMLDVYIEPSFHVDEGFWALRPPIYLHGYFQSARYFDDQRAEIRSVFTPRHPLSATAAATRATIEFTEMPVAVHIRRGDFSRRTSTRAYHGLLDAEYYRHALELIDALTGGEAHYFVFSDEPQAARALLDWAASVTVVEGNDRRPHEDMTLMSACRHAVIANSSFSWWGAWLTDHAGKHVVAPRHWMAPEQLRKQSIVDLYPERWILV
jgi:hypothetical protein